MSTTSDFDVMVAASLSGDFAMARLLSAPTKKETSSAPAQREGVVGLAKVAKRAAALRGEILYQVKLDRHCPRCRAHHYHYARREMVPKAGKIMEGYWRVTISCANCGHDWQGRFKRDEWE